VSSGSSAFGAFGSQQGALTDTEAKAVARILSDPSYFPMEFRAWIKNYIETSDITLPASSITGLGGASASGKTGLPPGLIVIYAGSTFGPDALPCNGALISRADYDKLFDAIGESWGAGDGSSTFAVPDLRDRALYMAGSVVALATTDENPVGSRGGAKHHHPINLPTTTDAGHKHNADNNLFALTSGDSLSALGAGQSQVDFYRPSGYNSKTATGGAHQHAVAGNTRGGYDDSPSWAGVNFCITTGK
jgi:microcystin-dependent protein